jgi:multiple sugar transport system substrate-binding protein
MLPRTILYLLVLMIFMASCNSNKSNRDGGLSYWSSSNSGEIEFSKVMVNRWNLLHPNEKIQYQPVPEGQSSEEIILAAVVGKTTADIYSNMWQGSVEFYAKANVLVPLDTISGFMDFLYSRCDSTTINEITSDDGHIYQINHVKGFCLISFVKRLDNHYIFSFCIVVHYKKTKQKEKIKEVKF